MDNIFSDYYSFSFQICYQKDTHSYFTYYNLKRIRASVPVFQSDTHADTHIFILVEIIQFLQYISF